jgi:tetratricopeptide (TPR) repeat protein
METKEYTLTDAINRKEISVFVPDTLKRGDPFLVKIVYEAIFDTVPTMPSFIADREILLAPNDSALWWPLLASTTSALSRQVAPAIMQVTVPSGFVIVPTGPADSVYSVGSKTSWRFVYDIPKRLSEGFIVCASKNLVKNTIASADSSAQFSLYYDRARFNQELAGAVLRQLREAFSFFASLTGVHYPPSNISVAVVGTDDGRSGWYFADNVIIGRNSSAYSLYDSTILSSVQKNSWVHQLAHFCGIAATDSTFLFDEGWANYLTEKFFLYKTAGVKDAQRQTRLDIFSTTLDFYPSQTLAQGRTTGKNEEAIFSKRGSCVFLMLEYILGEESFRIVTRKLYEKFSVRPVTIPEFEQLCEEVYGSSLDWFFNEWVYQVGLPELIFSSDITQTNRGSYLLKARISQRGDVFKTPVDLVFTGNARSLTKRVLLDSRDQEFEFILPFLPTKSEIDPNYFVLRWIPQLRLLAHARTAVGFRVFDHDLANSEREAMLTLQLDPNNLTGWNNIALFALGKSAVLKGEMTKAEEYFRRASELEANEPTQIYSVLSLVRLGNVLEMEGKRNEAVEIYKLSVTIGERNPVLYGIALSEALKYVREKFVSSDQFWYGEY